MCLALNQWLLKAFRLGAGRIYLLVFFLLHPGRQASLELVLDSSLLVSDLEILL